MRRNRRRPGTSLAVLTLSVAIVASGSHAARGWGSPAADRGGVVMPRGAFVSDTASRQGTLMAGAGEMRFAEPALTEAQARLAAARSGGPASAGPSGSCPDRPHDDGLHLTIFRNVTGDPTDSDPADPTDPSAVQPHR